MKIRILPVSLMPAALFLAMVAVASQPAARSADDEKLVTITANDSLKFSVTEIDASPGQKIHVSMGHNWILLDSEAEANTYATTAMSARNVEYQPKSQSSHVLAFIPLLGPKEVGDVSFCAPTKPGKYPYICSCSGHSLAGMKGVLIVK